MVVIQTQAQIKMTVFGDVNVSVYENSDVLKFTFTFKCVQRENQKCNYFNHLLYIAALYLLFIPVSFMKFNPLSLSWYFFYKILERSCSSGDIAKWQTTTCPETVHHIARY